MGTTLKSSGASCPSCHEQCPAEYAMRGERARWQCSCGAGGELTGSFSIRGGSDPAGTAKTPPTKTVHKPFPGRCATP